MLNRYSNIKRCPVCGHRDWQSIQKDELIDKTTISSFDKKKVWWRKCRHCDYEERIEGSG